MDDNYFDITKSEDDGFPIPGLYLCKSGDSHFNNLKKKKKKKKPKKHGVHDPNMDLIHFPDNTILPILQNVSDFLGGSKNAKLTIEKKDDEVKVKATKKEQDKVEYAGYEENQVHKEENLSETQINKPISQNRGIIKLIKKWYSQGMTQQQIADRLGTTQSYISKIINGNDD